MKHHIPSGVTIVGLDCSTDPRKCGIAVARLTDGTASLTHVVTPRSVAELVEVVGSESWPLLIAVDAPLGWPHASRDLAGHQAGRALNAAANQLFRRRTDEFVRAELGQNALDVGADRIARTAHAALGYLDQIRTRFGALDLAWVPEDVPRNPASAIEVYPAASLRALGFPNRGYKAKTDVARATRLDLCFKLRATGLVVGPEPVWQQAAESEHLLDAIVCVLAGLDFLAGEAMTPPSRAEVEKEGWIWVRPLSRTASQPSKTARIDVKRGKESTSSRG